MRERRLRRLDRLPPYVPTGFGLIGFALMAGSYGGRGGSSFFSPLSQFIGLGNPNIPPLRCRRVGIIVYAKKIINVS